MTHSCVTWLIDTWHDSIIRDMTQSYVTWLIHTWHDSSIRDMTYWHMPYHQRKHGTAGVGRFFVFQRSQMLCAAACCSVLQCDAVHYSMLQFAAACCSVLPCVTVCCSFWHCLVCLLRMHTVTPLRRFIKSNLVCNTLQHTATHCIRLQHTATHCNTLIKSNLHCNTLKHTTTHCNTLQHTHRI